MSQRLSPGRTVFLKKSTELWHFWRLIPVRPRLILKSGSGGLSPRPDRSSFDAHFIEEFRFHEQDYKISPKTSRSEKNIQ
jgi:hypothetical protein